MCTIIVMHRWHREFPLVVAANRDEFYDRPARPPGRLLDSPLAVGGSDGRHGGSWFGVTATGLLVALTNQRTYGLPDPSLASRGRIVVEALARGTVEGAIDYVAALDAPGFNPFNLLVADADDAVVAYGRPDAAHPQIEPISQGLVVLANDRIGSPEFPKADRAATLVGPLRDAPWPELSAGLQSALGDHELPSADRVPSPPPGSLFGPELLVRLQALCIHTPTYGTRSASIVAAARGRVLDYRTCATAPCQGAFRDSMALLGYDPAARRGGGGDVGRRRPSSQ